MSAMVAAPRRRRERLEGLNTPATARTHRPTPRNTPPRTQKITQDAAHTCCDAPDIQSLDGGGQECVNCGAQFNLESELRAEITFGETSTGAAVVQGGFVGENQRYANTMGGTVRGLPGLENREKTLRKGEQEIIGLVAALNLREVVKDMAYSLYKLASINNFVQGRRIRNVAACCIYLADRKQKESTLLLMDLAERIRVNVWVLGDTYKQFLATIMDTDPASVQGIDKVPQLEPLVLKFCRRLEFESDSYRVAEDACRMLKRMKRDWMVEGRQPAGLIGAAIIIAARMNGFRRTVREVVYCVKVADSTINQRLTEFKRTKSSHLTVAQWREYGLRLKDNMLPPAIYMREEREERKRKRAAALAGQPDDEDLTGDAEVVPRAAPSAKRVSKRRKTSNGNAKPTASNAPLSSANRDADGFLIPDIPLNPEAQAQDAMDFESESHLEYVAAAAAPEARVEEADEEFTVPKRRGRPPKKLAPIVIAPEDLEIEADIENEVRETIHAWEDIFSEFGANDNHPVLRAAGDKAQMLAREHMPDRNIRLTEEVGEDEFEDDEDVRNCLNTPQEVLLKEKIWTTQNEDWLRAQQAKLLAKELEEASGKTKKPKRKYKRSVLGDGSVLGGKPAASSAEAVEKMMQKRAKFSSHIDYAKLQELFGPGEQTGEGSTPSAGTPAESAATPQPAQQKEVVEIQDRGEEEAEEEYEEEEEEQYEEEPLEDGMYISDEDVGFEDIPDDF